jgi:hypothetical protein
MNDTVADRLATLEESNRRLRKLVFVSPVATVGLLLLAGFQGQEPSAKADSKELKVDKLVAHEIVCDKIRLVGEDKVTGDICTTSLDPRGIIVEMATVEHGRAIGYATRLAEIGIDVRKVEMAKGKGAFGVVKLGWNTFADSPEVAVQPAKDNAACFACMSKDGNKKVTISLPTK